MKLHQFLVAHRDELVSTCLRNLKRDHPEQSHVEKAKHLRPFLAEVTRTLRRADGTSDENLPSDPPPSVLEGDRPDGGFRIEHLAPMFSALSMAVGELAGRLRLAFSAEERRILNQLIDEHVAKAIDDFAAETRRAHESDVTEQLGFLAHELRNALASASMAFRLLENGQVGVGGATADVVRRNLVRMETLIEQSLLAARLRSGVKPGLRNVLLGPLVRNVVSSAVSERGIRLYIDVEEGLRVAADEHLLTTALSNLLQNAIKFSHDDATVVVRVRHGSAVTIEVEDECGGLPDGKREDLFKPFAQHGADRRGLGLGLTIARDAVRALGGEVAVRDLPGKGCVFAVQLPALTKSPR